MKFTLDGPNMAMYQGRIINNIDILFLLQGILSQEKYLMETKERIDEDICVQYQRPHLIHFLMSYLPRCFYFSIQT